MMFRKEKQIRNLASLVIAGFILFCSGYSKPFADMVGAQIGNTVVMFSSTETMMGRGEFNINATGSDRIIITDLIPDREYDALVFALEDNEVAFEDRKTSSAAGLLDFTPPPLTGGKYLVSIRITGGLYPGWNLISIPFQLPDNTTIDTALDCIAGKYNSVWTWVCDPAHAEGGYWERYVPGLEFLNNMGTLNPGDGYWINMADSGVLTLSGEEASADITLEPGWNLVGWNFLTVEPIEEALSSITDYLNSVWTWICDPTHTGGGYWKRYVPLLPTISDMETLEPWMGLWIEASDNCTWDVSGTYRPGPASLPVAAALRSSHVSSYRPEMPYVIWGSVEVDGVDMISEGRNAGTAPAVLLKVDNKVQSSCRPGTAGRHGDFYVLDVPATTDSHLELYVQIGDTVMKAATVPPGRPGQIMRFDLSVQLPPKVSQLHQNYPNPFNPGTWIPYQLREDAHVLIRIYTATGKLVRTLNLGYKPAGFYTDKEKAAYWDGSNEAGEHIASGVYFYSIKAGDLTTTKKMAIAE